ncbi:hypothetical protein [Streptomyces sp. 891-h]|uniref:DUF7739 domain-containing protein n=1 Tax=Streptomyces sp. 891-h TaxID=2720714 RepID=UPI001FAAFA49|nr:hypothetical protein [Streptomyces sp. 891-h]UNZ20612.1 hypothetical protein HC362_29650 [Streptomyces sp. 891-h]
MGWNISHRPDADDMCYSATSTHNLGQQIAHVLPARDWRRVRPLFDRRSGDPFTVSARDAGDMARILTASAQHPKMPADWAQDAQQLADSARKAADTRSAWTWR